MTLEEPLRSQYSDSHQRLASAMMRVMVGICKYTLVRNSMHNLNRQRKCCMSGVLNKREHLPALGDHSPKEALTCQLKCMICHPLIF